MTQVEIGGILADREAGLSVPEMVVKHRRSAASISRVIHGKVHAVRKARIDRNRNWTNEVAKHIPVALVTPASWDSEDAVQLALTILAKATRRAVVARTGAGQG